MKRNDFLEIFDLGGVDCNIRINPDWIAEVSNRRGASELIFSKSIGMVW